MVKKKKKKKKKKRGKIIIKLKFSSDPITSFTSMWGFSIIINLSWSPKNKISEKLRVVAVKNY